MNVILRLPRSLDAFDGLTVRTDAGMGDGQLHEADWAWLFVQREIRGGRMALSEQDVDALQASALAYGAQRQRAVRHLFKAITRARARARARERRGRGARLFVQSGKALRVPVRKARAVGTILATNGEGTHETWEQLDAWVAAEGLGTVLERIGWIYEANGTAWDTGEQNWWISQLAPEGVGGLGSAL